MTSLQTRNNIYKNRKKNLLDSIKRTVDGDKNIVTEEKRASRSRLSRGSRKSLDRDLLNKGLKQYGVLHTKKSIT